MIKTPNVVAALFCGSMLVLLAVFNQIPGAQATTPGLDQAVANYRAGKYSQALVQLQTLNQSDPLVHYYMALCYQNTSQIGRAQQEYQMVSQIARDPQLRQNAQIGYQQLSQYQTHRSYSGQGGVYHASSGSSATASYSSGGSGGRPKVLDFFATWCGPCKELAPRLEAIESRYSGRVEFQTIDIDENESMKNQYHVKAVPTLVFIDGQGNIVDRLEGGPPNMVLVSEIERLLRR